MRGERQARRTGIAAAVVALGMAVAGCAGIAGPPADAQRACWPRFPYQQGWLGGDGAYSVPLSPTRSLWLFGDTFVGRPEQRDRVGGALVHNSVGVSECRDGRFTIEYAWGAGPDGAPRAFLERPESGGWWWLFGAFMHGGALYVGLLEVERSPPRGRLGIPFRYTGSALARVENPDEPPARWRTQLLPLARGPVAHPVSAFAVAAPHLYLFAFLDLPEGRHPRILARLPLAALAARDAAPAAALETWTRDGRWTPGWRPDEAAIVMEDNASEMSVRHHPESGRWVALYNFPDVAGAFPGARPSDAVWARTAPAPEGPWSEPRLAFRIPELAGDGDPHLGCYAAKEQAQFSRPGSVTFTYVCNLFSGPAEDPFAVLRRLQRRMDLYRPIAVTVTLPEPPPDERAGAGTLDPAGPRH